MNLPSVLRAALAASIALAPAAHAQTYVYRIPLQGVDAAQDPGGGQGSPLSVGTYPSPAVQAGQPLSIAAPPVSGGTAPYAFGGGAGLPTGTVLNADGSITGTPLTQGQYAATVTVTDSSNPQRTASAAVSLTVTAPPQAGQVALSLSPAVPAEAMVGIPFPTITATASGGQAPYSYAASGSLPGVSLSGNALSGTPTAAGTHTVGVTATDSQAQPSSQTAGGTVTVYAAFDAAISGAPQASAERNAQIAPVTVTATGGKGPYAYTATGLPPGLSFDGTLRGAPTAAGTYSITLTAKEGFAQSSVSFGPYQVTVAEEPLTIASSPALPSEAMVGVPIASRSITTAGGTPPATITATGALPDGLTFDGSTLSGTPAAGSQGSYEVSFVAFDSAGQPAANTLGRTLSVLPALSATPSAAWPTEAVRNQAIAPVTLAVAGGKQPYAYESSGLPGGMSFGAGGLSGAPAAAGTYHVTLRVRESYANQEVEASFDLSVAQSVPVAVSYAGTPPQAGTTGVAMAPYSVTATGGSGTYTYDLSGAPAWLSVTTQGVVAGIPPTTGTFTYSVVAKDAQNPALTAQTPATTIVVTGPVSIPTALLERPLRENAYSFQMTASGGDGGPYTWTQSGLPPTLALSASGLITGTPTASGTYNVTFTARDSHNRTASKTLALTVDDPASAASNSLLVQATTTASAGYVQLNGAALASNAANLDQVIKASQSSYSFYGLTNGQNVTFRYSQNVAFSRFTSRIRALNGSVTLAVETSPDGSNWNLVQTISLTSGMAGTQTDSAAGGQMITIDVALGSVTQGTYARIRRTNGGSWVGIGPGGFL